MDIRKKDQTDKFLITDINNFIDKDLGKNTKPSVKFKYPSTMNTSYGDQFRNAAESPPLQSPDHRERSFDIG